MQHVTVRRWASQPPQVAWERLCDVERPLADDPDLELVSGASRAGTLQRGDRLVIRHQRGHRTTRLVVEVTEALSPSRLLARVRTRSTCWLLDVTLTPLEDGVTDLHLHAHLERGSGGAGRPAAPRRVGEGVSILLDSLAHHVSDAVATPV